MMRRGSDYAADRDIRVEQSATNQARRAAAEATFETVAEYAWLHNLRLAQRSETHYQLTDIQLETTWILNIYPGNCRLYHDKNLPMPPFLKLGAKWTLRQVVEAMVRTIAQGLRAGLKVSKTRKPAESL